MLKKEGNPVIKQKRIMAINDISCFGKCSLTVALPILSSAGFETAVIPTAVLSTHTGGFKNYTFLDLSDNMIKVAKHWKDTGIEFDCMYSGYLGSESQIDTTIEIADNFNIPFVFVDPVMGDNGKLYAGFSESFPEKMNILCKRADIITPNITEAALLTKTEYTEHHTKDYAEEILSKLSESCDKIIMTGLRLNPSEITTAVYQNDEIRYITNKNIDGMYHGTGDVFASSLLCGILNGLTLYTSAKIAVEHVSECILKTKELNGNVTYGVDFEQCTKGLLEKLGVIK